MPNILKKRICLVIPSLQAGGMERVMSELAHYFSLNSNLDNFLVILGRSDRFYPIPENVTIYEPGFVFNPRFRLYYTLKTIMFLRNRVKRIKPDTILSFGEMYNSFVLLSTLWIKARVYVSDRSKPDKRWGRIHELLRRIFYKRATGIIAQTSYAKQFLEAEIKHNNIQIIPNPINLPHLKKSEKQNVILNVGRLISTKRIDILLEVFSKINDKDWQLWIVGDGPLRNKLEETAIRLGLGANIKFWGNQADIESFYSKAKIFAFTSVSEGFPNAILEAMASGLPCISFDCVAGPSDLIEHNANGFLIPEHNVPLYTTYLKKLMDEPDLCISFGMKAQDLASKYKIEVIGEQYLKFMCIL